MDFWSLLMSPRLWFFIIMFAASGLVLITVVWFERKAAARVQMRVGPYHVSPWLGGIYNSSPTPSSFSLVSP